MFDVIQGCTKYVDGIPFVLVVMANRTVDPTGKSSRDSFLDNVCI